MPGPSDFERAQIDALLCPKPRPIRPRTATYLCPDLPRFNDVFETAVAPALRKNDIDAFLPFRIFDSDTPLATVFEHLQTTELILVDLTFFVPDVLYTLGLAHAIGRCPLLLAQSHSDTPPFDLRALRHVTYNPDAEGLRNLREDLTRTIRVHLAGIRAMPTDDDVT